MVLAEELMIDIIGHENTDPAVRSALSGLDSLESRAGATNSSLNGMNIGSGIGSGIEAGVNRGSAALDGLASHASSVKENISSAFSSLGNSLSNFNMGGMSGAISTGLGALGLGSITNFTLQNSMAAETNKVLMETMTNTKAEAISLWNTADKATNTSLFMMRDLVPAMAAFKGATNANSKELELFSNVSSRFASKSLAMGYSPEITQSAVMAFSRGINGAFAALDQYGITAESLKSTGYWNGEKEDVEGFLKAVDAITGDTSKFMDTAQGKLKLLTKSFSSEGRKIADNWMNSLHGVLDWFNKLNKTTGGLSTQAVIYGAISASALMVGLPVLGSIINGYDTIKSKINSMRGIVSGETSERLKNAQVTRNHLQQQIGLNAAKNSEQFKIGQLNAEASARMRNAGAVKSENLALKSQQAAYAKNPKLAGTAGNEYFFGGRRFDNQGQMMGLSASERVQQNIAYKQFMAGAGGRATPINPRVYGPLPASKGFTYIGDLNRASNWRIASAGATTFTGKMSALGSTMKTGLSTGVSKLGQMGTMLFGLPAPALAAAAAIGGIGAAVYYINDKYNLSGKTIEKVNSEVTKMNSNIDNARKGIQRQKNEINNLKKEQDKTVEGSKKYNELQSQINAKQKLLTSNEQQLNKTIAEKARNIDGIKRAIDSINKSYSETNKLPLGIDPSTGKQYEPVSNEYNLNNAPWYHQMKQIQRVSGGSEYNQKVIEGEIKGYKGVAKSQIDLNKTLLTSLGTFNETTGTWEGGAVSTDEMQKLASGDQWAAGMIGTKYAIGNLLGTNEAGTYDAMTAISNQFGKRQDIESFQKGAMSLNDLVKNMEQRSEGGHWDPGKDSATMAAIYQDPKLYKQYQDYIYKQNSENQKKNYEKDKKTLSESEFVSKYGRDKKGKEYGKGYEGQQKYAFSKKTDQEKLEWKIEAGKLEWSDYLNPMNWGTFVSNWTQGDWIGKIANWTTGGWFGKITKWSGWSGKIDRWTDWASKIIGVNLADFVFGSGNNTPPGHSSNPTAPTDKKTIINTHVSQFNSGGGGTSTNGPNASGGNVFKGRPTIVGEVGREIFIPNESGRIYSNNQVKRMFNAGRDENNQAGTTHIDNSKHITIKVYADSFTNGNVVAEAVNRRLANL